MLLVVALLILKLKFKDLSTIRQSLNGLNSITNALSIKIYNVGSIQEPPVYFENFLQKALDCKPCLYFILNAKGEIL